MKEAEEYFEEFKPVPDAPVDTLSATALAVEPPEGYTKTEGRPQVHFSGLDTLWGCGVKFERIYIFHERPDANVAMMVGSAVDRVVSRDLETKMLTGKLMQVEQIRDLANDAMLAEWNRKAVVLSSEERFKGEKIVRGDAIDKTVRLAVLHHNEIAPTINATHVQRLWSIEIPGFPFDIVGAIDVQEGSETIRDTKTKAKSPAAGEVDMTDQLTMYSLAAKTLDGVAPAEVILDCLVDNKTPVAKVYRSTRNHDDYQILMNRIENAAEVIQKGAFTPAQPTDWRCTMKWCGFAPTCRYFKKPKSTVIDPGE